MELRHLRYFTAICDTMSFRKAAETLHIAQPPLSQQIKALEQELGTPLFIRNGRSISLTPAGAAFRERAVAILIDARHAQSHARAVAAGQAGRLNIHFISSAITGTLQNLITAYKAAHPGIDITLSQSTINRIIPAVAEGAVDIGFIRTPQEISRDLISIPLLKESYFIALPAGHRLAGKSILTPADLREEPMIATPRVTAPGLYDDVLSLFYKAKITPKIAQEAPEQLTIAGLVAAGMGFAVVPECMTGITIPGLIHRPLRGGRHRTSITLIAKRNHSPAAARILALARKPV